MALLLFQINIMSWLIMRFYRICLTLIPLLVSVTDGFTISFSSCIFHLCRVLASVTVVFLLFHLKLFILLSITSFVSFNFNIFYAIFLSSPFAFFALALSTPFISGINARGQKPQVAPSSWGFAFLLFCNFAFV